MPIQLTSQAYCKMLLHAAKYPHCAVNGLLVAEKSKEKKSHSEPVLCVDCVPLFHGTLALAPMLEVALTLVRDPLTNTKSTFFLIPYWGRAGYCHSLAEPTTDAWVMSDWWVSQTGVFVLSLSERIMCMRSAFTILFQYLISNVLCSLSVECTMKSTFEIIHWSV